MHFKSSTRICLTLCGLLFSLLSFAQNTPNEKVLSAFSPDQLTELSTEEIKKLNFISNEGFLVSFMPEKAKLLPDLTERDPDVSPTNINPLTLGIEPSDSHQRFRIGSSGYVVIFFSDARLEKIYQRSTANNATNLK